MNSEIYNKKCPKCSSIQTYKNAYTFKRANRENTWCRKCAQQKIWTTENKKKASMRQQGANNNMFGRRGKLSPRFGVKHTKATKKKMRNHWQPEPWNKGKTGIYSESTLLAIRKARARQSPPMLNKSHSLEARKKMSDNNWAKTLEGRKCRRLARIKEILEKGGGPNYNPDACKIIDEYGAKHGYNFQHAENGGEFYIEELGYWVDGYDEEKNTVIEVDESRHYINGKLRKGDVRRQEEIEKHLNCVFVRIRI